MTPIWSASKAVRLTIGDQFVGVQPITYVRELIYVLCEVCLLLDREGHHDKAFKYDP